MAPRIEIQFFISSVLGTDAGVPTYPYGLFDIAWWKCAAIGRPHIHFKLVCNESLARQMTRLKDMFGGLFPASSISINRNPPPWALLIYVPEGPRENVKSRDLLPVDHYI